MNGPGTRSAIQVSAPPPELERIPLVENQRSPGWITDKVAGIIEGKTPAWWGDADGPPRRVADADHGIWPTPRPTVVRAAVPPQPRMPAISWSPNSRPSAAAKKSR